MPKPVIYTLYLPTQKCWQAWMEEDSACFANGLTEGEAILRLSRGYPDLCPFVVVQK